MQPERRPANAVARPGVALGLVFVALALAQAWFAYIFMTIATVVSQTPWYTINSRWVYPSVALASSIVFARWAWRCFRPGRPTNQDAAVR
jgi:hypothetical protein